MMEKILRLPLLSGLLLLVVLSACNNDREQLRSENDSLRAALETREQVMMTMRDVKTLLDSIDYSRKVLHLDLVEGTSYQDFNTRLTDINEYVKKTESKITNIQNQLRSAKGEASAYMLMVSALSDELKMSTAEVETLTQQVEDYKAENKGLVKTVKLQEDQIVEMHSKIATKQQELVFLEAKVDEMVSNFKVTEAEAYFARARAVEEAAKRTHLAPAKRKQSYKEALDLYKQALSLGKADAQSKIDELSKKVR